MAPYHPFLTSSSGVGGLILFHTFFNKSAGSSLSLSSLIFSSSLVLFLSFLLHNLKLFLPPLFLLNIILIRFATIINFYLFLCFLLFNFFSFLSSALRFLSNFHSSFYLPSCSFRFNSASN